MSVARLRAFHAVALEGTVQGGANRLKISQPAVSQHLRQIDEASDKPLFRRGGHRLELTESGRALFNAVEQLLSAEDRVERVLDGRESGRGATLTVGSDGPFNVLDVVAELRRRRPDVRVEVRLGNSTRIWAELLDLRIDVAMIAGPPESKRTYREPLIPLGLVAVVPASNRLAAASSVTLEQLKSEALIFRETGSTTQRLLDEAFLERGIDISPTMVMGSRESVQAAVMRGLGIGFGFDCEIGFDPRAVGVPVSGFEGITADEVVCLKAQRTNPLVMAFFDCIPTVAFEFDRRKRRP